MYKGHPKKKAHNRSLVSRKNTPNFGGSFLGTKLSSKSSASPKTLLVSYKTRKRRIYSILSITAASFSRFLYLLLRHFGAVLVFSVPNEMLF